MMLTNHWVMKKTKISINDEQVSEDGLDTFTVIGQSTAPPRGSELKGLPLEINQQQILPKMKTL